MLKEKSDLQFGEFIVDRHARELRRNEKVLPLSSKAFDLLTYMLENPGRPLSKSRLLNAVWTETNVGESNLSQNVFLLRRLLGSDNPIKTLRGHGYQFSAQVIEMQATNAFGSPLLPVEESHPSISIKTAPARRSIPAQRFLEGLPLHHGLPACKAAFLKILLSVLNLKHFKGTTLHHSILRNFNA